MMENIYGQKTEDASSTFEKIKKVKLFSNETDNTEIIKKLDDITVDVCIKCEDVIEEFCTYKDETVFSKEKDAIARKLLYNVLVDSKAKFYEKNIYYNRTIDELTAVIKELQQKNKELSEQNRELVERVKKIEEKRTQIFEYVKNNSEETPKGVTKSESDRNIMKLLMQMEVLSDRKDLQGFIQRMENEEALNKNEKSNVNENKEMNSKDIADD